MLNLLRKLLRDWFASQSHKIHSVGEALDVEPGLYTQSLRDAVEAINQVHQDGKLPAIRLAYGSLFDRHGQFSLQGSRISITINSDSPHIQFTTVHEIGHFLDYSGIGSAGILASEIPGIMDRWRSSVKLSRNFQRLTPLIMSGTTQAKETAVDGTVVEYEVDQDYLSYLLQPRELWARSYAQFIAVKSGLPDLCRQLDTLRERPRRMFYYGEQWDEDDFKPILASIEAIFSELGWM